VPAHVGFGALFGRALHPHGASAQYDENVLQSASLEHSLAAAPELLVPAGPATTNGAVVAEDAGVASA
jgi:hypothetical protein